MQNEFQRLETEDPLVQCESSQAPAELSCPVRQCTGPSAGLAFSSAKAELVSEAAMFGEFGRDVPWAELCSIWFRHRLCKPGQFSSKLTLERR